MVVFLPKSNTSCKGSQTTGAEAGRLYRLLKPQTNGTTGPPSVNDDGSRFPMKSSPLQTRFFIWIAQWSVEEDDIIMSKVVIGKGKTVGKNGKPENGLRSKTTNRHSAFKITIRSDC